MYESVCMCKRARALLRRFSSRARLGSFYQGNGNEELRKKNKENDNHGDMKKEVIKKMLNYDSSFERETDRIDLTSHLNQKMFNRYF